jgi:predicted unusual protein kinase regulating ubiquinone biosynthesis (AarF/ABC1/UbiB family)
LTRERRITTSRIGRLGQLGRLVGGLATGMVAEGARQVGRGQRPKVADMLLTPANMGRLADRLSEMRGAAMKVGQLLSMDSGEVLPAQLGELLARLREDAHQIPLGQVAEVLQASWGPGWEKQFSRFVFQPIAAASIGQVHEAVHRDAGRIAVKIQYPGIRRSIDSDVDNVATLLNTFRILPEDMDLQALLDEAKRQLHAEADYRVEADALRRFAGLVADDPRFELPAVFDDLTDASVLTMGFMDGAPIETLAEQSRPRRDAAAAALTELALREVYQWGVVQTDPNFANYLHDPKSGRIQLLDFGATREYENARREAICDLLVACIDGDDADVLAGAETVGYTCAGDPAGYRAAILRLLRTACEPAAHDGDFHFGSSDIGQRMTQIVIDMRMQSRFTRLPPPDILFLHRKLGGLYLLLSRLRARLPVRSLVAEVLDAGAAEVARAAG